jgi:Ala-tRNA(Pro) deacylase
MTQKEIVLQALENLNIPYKLYEHPPAPTIGEAMKYWKDIDARHCKNLFFRNHKGNRHYLVILEHSSVLNIHELEKKLKQGKISFASDERMMKYLGLMPGSVSIFGLINDLEKHVHVFLDKKLLTADRISFHPNINTASVVISFSDFEKFLKWKGNSFEYIDMD